MGRSALFLMTAFAVVAMGLAALTPAVRAGEEKAPGKAQKDAPPAPAEVVIRKMKYSPAAVSIKVGQTVTWINDDDRDHTVNGGKAFNSGTIGAGESYTHKFTKAGTYAYGCKLHPRMKGTVEVK